MKRRDCTRFTLMLALVVCAASVWVMGNMSTAATAAQSNFVGGDPQRPDSSDIRALRLRFEPGSRSNWHSHGQYQVSMAEEGRGRTQIQGEAVQDMLPGVPYYAGPGVVHWHGASPDQHMVQLTVVTGQTSWEGPVSDEDYLGSDQ